MKKIISLASFNDNFYCLTEDGHIWKDTLYDTEDERCGFFDEPKHIWVLDKEYEKMKFGKYDNKGQLQPLKEVDGFDSPTINVLNLKRLKRHKD